MGKRKRDANYYKRKIRKMENKLKELHQDSQDSSDEETTPRPPPQQLTPQQATHTTNIEELSSILDKEVDATIQTEVDHIPEELLLALGKEGEEKEEIGEPIIPELALRWSKIMSEGLGKEARTGIINKYPTPSNFPKGVAPIMNPEIRVTLSETSVKRDKRIVTRQNLTGILMTCLGKSLTNILKGNINSKMLIEEINDAAKIAADIHYQDSSSRKFFALSGASKPIQDAVKTSKTDTFLFGTDCADKIKTAQTIQRTGTQITDATKQNKQYTTNKKQLNWRGPPQNQHQVHQQARGGQRPQQYPLQQHKRQNRFDRPRQTQQRQPPARSKSRHYR